MSPFSPEHALRIELDAENCECSPEQIQHMERALDVLRSPLRDFPVSDLYINVWRHPHRREVRVKTALVLPGRTIATGDFDETLHPAFERCVRKLVQRVEAYKAQLGHDPVLRKVSKGTLHEVTPAQEPNLVELEEAVAAGDYRAFRAAMSGYDEAVRLRAGRWIDRYPELAAQLGERVQMDDVVEEVFLNAFERFTERPQQVRLGEWLEQWIDPSVKLLLRAPDEELQNISFARTLRGEA